RWSGPRRRGGGLARATLRPRHTGGADPGGHPRLRRRGGGSGRGTSASARTGADLGGHARLRHRGGGPGRGRAPARGRGGAPGGGSGWGGFVGVCAVAKGLTKVVSNY